MMTRTQFTTNFHFLYGILNFVIQRENERQVQVFFVWYKYNMAINAELISMHVMTRCTPNFGSH